VEGGGRQSHPNNGAVQPWSIYGPCLYALTYNVTNMLTENQINSAMDAIAKKNWDPQTLVYDMQNSSTVDHHNADLRQWLAGMNDYGYKTLIERLKRMDDRV
jgi:hypothetical protein